MRSARTISNRSRCCSAAGADVNQVTGYGWSPLLVATQNRYYKLGAYLLDHGADRESRQQGRCGRRCIWRPTTAISNPAIIRSARATWIIWSYIKLLLDKGANVNARVKDSTETRTVFTNQWLDENGATAFLRASQSGDVALMKLLLARGADPKIDDGPACDGAARRRWNRLGGGDHLRVVAGTNARSREAAAGPGSRPECAGRHRARRAARRGTQGSDRRSCSCSWTTAPKLNIRDYGNTDNRGGKLAVHTWEPVDYADGLVRVGVQSAIAHPETGLLLRKLMIAAGLPAPPVGRTLESICITEACD